MRFEMKLAASINIRYKSTLSVVKLWVRELSVAISRTASGHILNRPLKMVNSLNSVQRDKVVVRNILANTTTTTTTNT